MQKTSLASAGELAGRVRGRRGGAHPFLQLFIPTQAARAASRGGTHSDRPTLVHHLLYETDVMTAAVVKSAVQRSVICHLIILCIFVKISCPIRCQ